jgi:hypothetical protein
LQCISQQTVVAGAYVLHLAACFVLRPAGQNLTSGVTLCIRLLLRACVCIVLLPAGKNLTEKLVASYHKQHGLPVAIVRPSLVTGLAGLPYPGYCGNVAGTAADDDAVVMIVWCVDKVSSYSSSGELITDQQQQAEAAAATLQQLVINLQMLFVLDKVQGTSSPDASGCVPAASCPACIVRTLASTRAVHHARNFHFLECMTLHVAVV